MDELNELDGEEYWHIPTAARAAMNKSLNMLAIEDEYKCGDSGWRKEVNGGGSQKDSCAETRPGSVRASMYN